MSDLSRRDLLASTALALAATSLPACQAQKEKEKPPQITTGTVSVGTASDYPAGRANGKYLDMYGIFIANDSGTPVAIRPKCTHLGCALKWNDPARSFDCPCHGSRFSLLGLPIKGPAKRPLPMVPCGTNPDGKLTVDLTKLYSL